MSITANQMIHMINTHNSKTMNDNEPTYNELRRAIEEMCNEREIWLQRVSDIT